MEVPEDVDQSGLRRELEGIAQALHIDLTLQAQET